MFPACVDVLVTCLDSSPVLNYTRVHDANTLGGLALADVTNLVKVRLHFSMCGVFIGPALIFSDLPLLFINLASMYVDSLPLMLINLPFMYINLSLILIYLPIPFAN